MDQVISVQSCLSPFDKISQPFLLSLSFLPVSLSLPTPLAYTDRPVKQPITEADAATARLKHFVYQSKEYGKEGGRVEEGRREGRRRRPEAGKGRREQGDNQCTA